MDWFTDEDLSSVFSSKIISVNESVDDLILKDGEPDDAPQFRFRDVAQVSIPEVATLEKHRPRPKSRNKQTDTLSKTVSKGGILKKGRSKDDVLPVNFVRDVQKFVVSQTKGHERDEARMQLAMDLGAKAPKPKAVHYKELKEKRAAELQETKADMEKKSKEMSSVKMRKKRKLKRKK